MNKKTILMLILLALVGVLLSCQQPLTINITGKIAEIDLNKTFQVEAKLVGDILRTGESLEYISGNDKIAKIDSKGLLTSMDVGETTIQVKLNSDKRIANEPSFRITVRPDATSIKLLEGAELRYSIDQPKKISYEVLADSQYKIVPNQEIEIDVLGLIEGTDYELVNNGPQDCTIIFKRYIKDTEKPKIKLIAKSGSKPYAIIEKFILENPPRDIKIKKRNIYKIPQYETNIKLEAEVIPLNAPQSVKWELIGNTNNMISLDKSHKILVFQEDALKQETKIKIRATSTIDSNLSVEETYTFKPGDALENFVKIMSSITQVYKGVPFQLTYFKASNFNIEWSSSLNPSDYKIEDKGDNKAEITINKIVSGVTFTATLRDGGKELSHSTTKSINVYDDITNLRITNDRIIPLEDKKDTEVVLNCEPSKDIPPLTWSIIDNKNPSSINIENNVLKIKKSYASGLKNNKNIDIKVESKDSQGNIISHSSTFTLLVKNSNALEIKTELPKVLFSGKTYNVEYRIVPKPEVGTKPEWSLVGTNLGALNYKLEDTSGTNSKGEGIVKLTVSSIIASAKLKGSILKVGETNKEGKEVLTKPFSTKDYPESVNVKADESYQLKKTGDTIISLTTEIAPVSASQETTLELDSASKDNNLLIEKTGNGFKLTVKAAYTNSISSHEKDITLVVRTVDPKSKDDSSKIEGNKKITLLANGSIKKIEDIKFKRNNEDLKGHMVLNDVLKVTYNTVPKNKKAFYSIFKLSGTKEELLDKSKYNVIADEEGALKIGFKELAKYKVYLFKNKTDKGNKTNYVESKEFYVKSNPTSISINTVASNKYELNSSGNTTISLTTKVTPATASQETTLELEVSPPTDELSIISKGSGVFELVVTEKYANSLLEDKTIKLVARTVDSKSKYDSSKVEIKKDITLVSNSIQTIADLEFKRTNTDVALTDHILLNEQLDITYTTEPRDKKVFYSVYKDGSPTPITSASYTLVKDEIGALSIKFPTLGKYIVYLFKNKNDKKFKQNEVIAKKFEVKPNPISIKIETVADDYQLEKTDKTIISIKTTVEPANASQETTLELKVSPPTDRLSIISKGNGLFDLVVSKEYASSLFEDKKIKLVAKAIDLKQDSSQVKEEKYITLISNVNIQNISDIEFKRTNTNVALKDHILRNEQLDITYVTNPINKKAFYAVYRVNEKGKEIEFFDYTVVKDEIGALSIKFPTLSKYIVYLFKNKNDKKFKQNEVIAKKFDVTAIPTGISIDNEFPSTVTMVKEKHRIPIKATITESKAYQKFNAEITTPVNWASIETDSGGNHYLVLIHELSGDNTPVNLGVKVSSIDNNGVSIELSDNATLTINFNREKINSSNNTPTLLNGSHPGVKLETLNIGTGVTKKSRAMKFEYARASSVLNNPLQGNIGDYTTVSVWLKDHSINEIQVITAFYGYSVVTTYTRQVYKIGFTTGNNDLFYHNIDGNYFNDGNWHNVVAVFFNTDKEEDYKHKLELYLDGVKCSLGFFSQNKPSNSNVKYKNDENKIGFGSWLSNDFIYFSEPKHYYYKGLMDEIIVVNGKVSEEKIREYYNNTKP